MQHTQQEKNLCEGAQDTGPAADCAPCRTTDSSRTLTVSGQTLRFQRPQGRTQHRDFITAFWSFGYDGSFAASPGPLLPHD